MRKLIAFVLAAVMLMSILCGCNILEMGTPPTLPRINYDESSLVGMVEYVNGRTCRISILEGDDHYRAATEKREADVIFVTFSDLGGKKSVQVGDTVRFTYAYTTDVTERDGEPHISVRKLMVE